MLQGWVVIAVALAYIGSSFLLRAMAIARVALAAMGRARLLIYPLSLAIYFLRRGLSLDRSFSFAYGLRLSDHLCRAGHHDRFV